MNLSAGLYPCCLVFDVQVKNLPAGLKPEEFDFFHEMIAHEEMAAFTCPGGNVQSLEKRETQTKKRQD